MDRLRRAVILAHFDQDGLLDAHVRATLASLAEIGADIVVVSTNLAAGETAAGVRIIRRDNAGYDFRSWYVGLQSLGSLKTYDEIVLMNDSFYLAREGALAEALDSLERRETDVGGLTASREFCFHLQSYFMVFRQSAIQTEWFRQFWEGIAPDADRSAAIRNYELPMALQAQLAGLKVSAILTSPAWPGTAFLAKQWSSQARLHGWRGGLQAVRGALRGRPGRNPTLHQWKATARCCGVVKVELLRANPHQANLADIGSYMEPACLSRACNHLARIRIPTITVGGLI